MLLKKKCKLIIYDEVNIKFEGLDAGIRSLCKDTLKFKLPGARYFRSVRMGRWNGEVSFFSIGGNSYLNLFPKIYEIIHRTYDIEIIDQRINHNIPEQLQPITNDLFSDKTWAKGHRLAGKPIVLDDHQVESINTCLKNRQCVVEASTGAGKTLISAALSYASEKYGRSIVIVPSKDLVAQTEEEYINLGLDVGVFFGGRKDITKTHTICTWQSLTRLFKDAADNKDDTVTSAFLKNVIMVLCDECHLVPGESITNLLCDHFKNVSLRWGITGTVPIEAHLQTSLLASLGETLYRVSAKELQDKGFLANCNIKIMQFLMRNKDAIAKDHVRFAEYMDEASDLATNLLFLKNLAREIIETSYTGNTFVLVDRIEAGQNLQKLIPNAIFLYGNVKSKKRKESYTDMNLGENKIIIATFGVASTGINIPRIFNLFLVNAGKSFIKTIQSIGRGIRKAEDKDSVTIYDICTNDKYSAQHLTKRKKYYKTAQYPFEIIKKQPDENIIISIARIKKDPNVNSDK